MLDLVEPLPVRNDRPGDDQATRREHDAGAAVMPASPGFYHRPETVAELVGTVTARTLDLLGIDNDRAQRWKE